jgi:hypothetical protein
MLTDECDRESIVQMERYHGVHGARRVARIVAALEASGARVLKCAPSDVAPFEFTILTSEGERLELVCYAFTANRYTQRGRPADEHRFQVKYGSEFDRVHKLFIDERRRKITLMFGVHDELDLFVAVDPAMHRVTWFSSSVEFKQHDLDEATRTGWHGWERERVAHGRRRANAEEDLRVETVLALRPERFGRYVQLERVAAGLDPAERLLLIQKQANLKSAAVADAVAHPLEEQLGLTPGEILEVIRGRGRLLTAVLGGVAEQHLERYLRSERAITSVERLDTDGPPDFTVRVRGHSRPVRIECKNVRRTLTAKRPWVDFQKTRAAKGNPCSRYYAASQFEVLAACLHPVTERWEFRFRETSALSPHAKCPGKLAERVILLEPDWVGSLPEIVDRLAG